MAEDLAIRRPHKSAPECCESFPRRYVAAANKGGSGGGLGCQTARCL